MDALTGAGIALLTLAITSGFQILRDRVLAKGELSREGRTDQRALRDAKLQRLREAFVPVLHAAWGYQTAGVDLIQHNTPSAEARALLAEALGGVNEARARVLLEADCRDVFDRLEKVRIAHGGMELAASDRGEGDPTAGKAFMTRWSEVKEGVAEIERLCTAHLSRIEGAPIG